jgi:hypothetical protein
VSVPSLWRTASQCPRSRLGDQPRDQLRLPSRSVASCTSPNRAVCIKFFGLRRLKHVLCPEPPFAAAALQEIVFNIRFQPVSTTAIATLPDTRTVCNSDDSIGNNGTRISGSGYGASKSLQSLARSPNGPGNHCTFHTIHCNLLTTRSVVAQVTSSGASISGTVVQALATAMRTHALTRWLLRTSSRHWALPPGVSSDTDIDSPRAPPLSNLTPSQSTYFLLPPLPILLPPALCLGPALDGLDLALDLARAP